MIILNLIRTLGPSSLTKKPYQPIISSLFKKKYQAEAPKAPAPESPQQQEEKQKEKQNKQPQDEQYNFFERRKQIDTSFDFSKLREVSSDNIPEDLGRGGLEEVLYWSQNAITPDQISHVLTSFNKVAKSHPKQLNKIAKHKLFLEDFNLKAIGNIYLVSSLELLKQYALFAYTYKVATPEFWEKIQFRALKFFPSTIADGSCLVDICFIMGQYQAGTQIYNHVSKMVQSMALSIDQYVKLFLTFNMLKIGQKPWLNKLLQGLCDNMHEADAEQLTGVLTSLKQIKKVPENMTQNIEKRVLELLKTFNLHQIILIVQYLGFEHQNQQTWRVLQERTVDLLRDKKIDVSLLSDLILKVLPTYKFTENFIRQYIVKPIEDSKLAVLDELELTTVSALSKGLYIYELQNQTKHIETELSKLVIGKMTKYINELSDSQIIKIIQDYNLSRNGSRELYIFLEEVVKIRYLRGYNSELDRHAIQLLIEIYGNSGMCTRETYQALQTLIIDS